MGYSNSRLTISRNREHLVKLLNTPSVINEVVWVTNDAKKFAYRLFNALKAAEQLNIEPYASLRNIWRIREKNGMVIAERQSMTTITGCASAHDVYDVIDYIVAHKDKDLEFPVIFPNINQDEETLRTMYTWATNHQLGMYVPDKGVILTNEITDKCWVPKAK